MQKYHILFMSIYMQSRVINIRARKKNPCITFSVEVTFGLLLYLCFISSLKIQGEYDKMLALIKQGCLLYSVLFCIFKVFTKKMK